MIDSWIRPSLKNFKAYSSARSQARQAEVFLDANELSIGSVLKDQFEGLTRYPDPESRKLRNDLARWLKVDESQVLVTSGSDQGIDVLLRLFCEPFEDSVAFFEPTYGMYRVSAELQGVKVRALSLDEGFDINAEEALAQLEGVKMVFLCSPNNPTGNLLNPVAIRRILDEFDGPVVMDQAYLEFCANQDVADWSRRVADYPNLIVLRTFSKAWGLAALRLGYVVAQPSVIQWLQRVMPPYPVSSMVEELGCKALKRKADLAESVSVIREQRELLAQRLTTVAAVNEVLPSEGNFLLVRFKDRDLAWEKLMAQGLCVRKRSDARLQDCLRLTVGRSSENERICKILEDLP